MIINERVRRLAELDREALVALMTAALLYGSHRYHPLRHDPDARELLDAARRLANTDEATPAQLREWNQHAKGDHP